MGGLSWATWWPRVTTVAAGKEEGDQHRGVKLLLCGFEDAGRGRKPRSEAPKTRKGKEMDAPQRLQRSRPCGHLSFGSMNPFLTLI